MEDFPDTVEKCMKILEENVEILADLEMDLDDKEDELISEMELYQLLDMADDVSFASKIKHAEFNLAQRQFD